MKKTDRNKIAAVLAFAAIMMMTFLFLENRRLKKINKKMEEEEEDLRLMLEKFNANESYNGEVKKQLSDLADMFEKIDRHIANEINQTLQLLEIRQIENAITRLSKIIENLLSSHYSRRESFLEWAEKKKKRAVFADFLEFCYAEDKKINRIEFHFIKTIKTIRNAETHDLDLQLNFLLNTSGIAAAVAGITKIAEFVYPQS